MTERQTSLILFYLRRSKVTRRDEASIYNRIIVNRKRSEMATNCSIDPKRWNSEGGFAKGIKTGFKELNEYLDILRSKVYHAQRKILE